MAVLAPINCFSCKLPTHGVHIPHLMRCAKCDHRWIDCPGEAGFNCKTGCPKCGHEYWTAEQAKKAGKLKELIKARRKLS